MKLLYDIVATTGEYEQDGKKKYRTLKIGAVFEKDNGYRCAKFECLPSGNYWNGWANLYEPNADKAAQQPTKASNSEDEIPF